MKSITLGWTFAAALVSLTAFAKDPLQKPEGEKTSVVDLSAVVVTGAYPAPGLWELTRDGKTLLIMGTLTPAPNRMTWTSERVEAKIAQADLILGSPGVVVGADVGLLRGAMLWPAYQRSKKNPNGQKLQDVLSPAVFVRWQGLKQTYLARDNDVDRLRPLYAAKSLFDAAVRSAGMTDESLVDPVVERVAKTHAIPTRTTAVRLAIADPKATLKKLNAIQLGDQDCLVQTMDRLEQDLATMVVRANAWADGNVDQLKALPFIDQKEACKRALVSNEIAQQQGITNLDVRIQEQWLGAVRKALSENDTVFATLPIAKLLENEGVLAALRGEGFAVKVPE